MIAAVVTAVLCAVVSVVLTVCVMLCCVLCAVCLSQHHHDVTQQSQAWLMGDKASDVTIKLLSVRRVW